MEPFFGNTLVDVGFLLLWRNYLLVFRSGACGGGSGWSIRVGEDISLGDCLV
jgi:hypothetical protein